MKPTKILEEKSRSDVVWFPTYRQDPSIEWFPVTNALKEAAEINSYEARNSKTPVERFNNMSEWLTQTFMAPTLWPITDVLWTAWNAVVNWYKRLYNAWADLSNRAKLKLIDKQIKDFQKKNPNKVSQPTWKGFEYESPAEKVKKAWAATDAEVWEATHQFWYWNDPRTVYRRLRYRKQQVSPKPRISL